ncbi:helix-turn-helix transcriptional regulator [Streptomyces roseoverticillatus]|uniref:helix-turn-helix transcriptional regulator n=1 Tax=Streptomyces roseoverticillatus TaxID=66429 RepID=UPI0033E71174
MITAGRGAGGHWSSHVHRGVYGTAMPHPLKLVRAMLGKTQSTFAEELAHRHQWKMGLGQMGISRSKVAGWESGRWPPDKPTQMTIADWLGIAWADAERLGWPHMLHLFLSDTETLTAPWTPQGAIEALRSAAQQADTQPRSSYLTVTGPAVEDLAGKWQKALSNPLPPSVREGKPIPLSVVDAARSGVGELEGMFWDISPAHLRPLASGFLRTLITFLSEYSYDRQAGGELFLLAARNAILCGALLIGMGESTRAERYFLIAARAAAAAGETMASAMPMAYVAYCHLIADSPGDVIPIIAAIRATAQGLLPPPFVAGLHLLEARARARLGDATAAVKSLEHADNALAADPASTAPLAFPLGKTADIWVSSGTGITWLHLGQPEKAMKFLTRLIDEFTPARIFPFAAYERLYIADAQIAVGDVAAAASHAARVLDLYSSPPAIARRYEEKFTAYRDVPAVRDLLRFLAEHTTR